MTDKEFENVVRPNASRLCIKCRHAFTSDETKENPRDNDWWCRALHRPASLVDGSNDPQRCAIERASFHISSCGPGGRFWEAK